MKQRFNSLQSSINAVRTAARDTIEFIYPSACLMCQCRELPSECDEIRLCNNCRTELAPKIEHSCVRCGARIGPFTEQQTARQGCIYCRKDRFAFDSVIRLGVYENRLREACLLCRQAGGEPLAAALADFMWQTEREAFRTLQGAVIVPVPLHWSQRIVRPHNPPATLAERLGRRLQGRICRHILRKRRKTPAQRTLPPSRRRANLRNAFRVRHTRAIQGRNVLLVDDVMTTGTTINEAAKILIAAGASRVDVAVVARGLGTTV